VNTFGTGKLSDRKLEQIITKVFDFTPAGMIKQFNLLDGNVYRKLPRTFFMDKFAWEKTDKIKELRQFTKA
jgi:S-adenosylmethionine synthetase